MAFYLKESHTYTHKRPCGLTCGYFPNVVAFYLKESHTFKHIYTHKTLWADIWLLSKKVVAFYLKESHTYTHKRPCGLTCGYFQNVAAFYLKGAHTQEFLGLPKTGGTDKQMLMASVWSCSCARSLAGS